MFTPSGRVVARCTVPTKVVVEVGLCLRAEDSVYLLQINFHIDWKMFKISWTNLRLVLAADHSKTDTTSVWCLEKRHTLHHMSLLCQQSGLCRMSVCQTWAWSRLVIWCSDGTFLHLRYKKKKRKLVGPRNQLHGIWITVMFAPLPNNYCRATLSRFTW